MEMVQCLKKDMEEIQQTYRKVELTAGAQAAHVLKEVEEFQKIYRVLTEQRPTSLGGLRGPGAVLDLIGVTSTINNHEHHLDHILQSADQGQKVMDALYKMREELKNLQMDKMMEKKEEEEREEEEEEEEEWKEEEEEKKPR
ncbi:hypothetical protein EPR50_G00173690 [Xyrichtys novacula]|uniref:Uncharacterized protein n=1 Tax=Xyrichtys novacula TaxID=13765 RepID=A0AAV1G8Z5_XYRNO|nr:hypothetical protein EPR50_G00173690 [Xyrichtys novacula]